MQRSVKWRRTEGIIVVEGIVADISVIRELICEQISLN